MFKLVLVGVDVGVVVLVFAVAFAFVETTTPHTGGFNRSPTQGDSLIAYIRIYTL